MTGASNVSNAMAFGKQAARSLDLQLMEADRWDKIFLIPEYGQTPPQEPSPSWRHTGRAVAPLVRVRSYDEVISGLEEDEALDEACRCLRCDVKVAAAT